MPGYMINDGRLFPHMMDSVTNRNTPDYFLPVFSPSETDRSCYKLVNFPVLLHIPYISLTAGQMKIVITFEATPSPGAKYTCLLTPLSHKNCIRLHVGEGQTVIPG